MNQKIDNILRWFKNHRTLVLSVLAITLAVLVIYVGMAQAGFFGVSDSTPIPVARNYIQTIMTGCRMFQLETGRFPNEDNWIEELTTKTEEHKRHMEKVPHDPWGNEYNYRWEGRHIDEYPDIWSNGRDGIEGTSDDRISWRGPEE